MTIVRVESRLAMPLLCRCTQKTV